MLFDRCCCVDQIEMEDSFARVATELLLLLMFDAIRACRLDLALAHLQRRITEESSSKRTRVQHCSAACCVM